MRIISYQNKRYAKILVSVLLAIIVYVLLFCICRTIYIQRYLCYEDNRVVLDYNQDLNKDVDRTKPADDDFEFDFSTEDPVPKEVPSSQLPLESLTGHYISTQMLMDTEKVNTALFQNLPLPEAVMLDVKSIYGNFYYSSRIPGAQTSSADIAAIDKLIADLADTRDVYMIARIASLSDTNFALEHQDCGLPLYSGALWMSNGCYWLDPMKEEVQEYLVSIATELAQIGFDEVVFDDFRIPDSDAIRYVSDYTRDDAAAEAAKMICEKLENAPIRVSFSSSNLQVLSYSDRVFFSTQDGAGVAAYVEGIQDIIHDPSSEIVFLTASRDTRFDGYSILRPLIEEKK